MCFELSQRNASIFIIAPLSCSAPIYKDLLGSPLHLKFSFISAGVTAEPADSCSIFRLAAGRRVREARPRLLHVGLLHGPAGLAQGWR